MNSQQATWKCPVCGATNVGPYQNCLVCHTPSREVLTPGSQAVPSPVQRSDAGNVPVNERGERIPADTTQVVASLLTPGVTLIARHLGGFAAPDGTILRWPDESLQGLGGRLDTSDGRVRLLVSSSPTADHGDQPVQSVADRAPRRRDSPGIAESGIVFRAHGGKVAALPLAEDSDSKFLALLATSLLNADGAVNQLLAKNGLSLVSVTANANGLIKVATAGARWQATPHGVPSRVAPIDQRLLPPPQRPPAPPGFQQRVAPAVPDRAAAPQPPLPLPQSAMPAATDFSQRVQGEARFCPNCGQQRRPGTRFCVRCGAKLPG